MDLDEVVGQSYVEEVEEAVINVADGVHSNVSEVEVVSKATMTNEVVEDEAGVGLAGRTMTSRNEIGIRL